MIDDKKQKMQEVTTQEHNSSKKKDQNNHINKVQQQNAEQYQNQTNNNSIKNIINLNTQEAQQQVQRDLQLRMQTSLCMINSNNSNQSKKLKHQTGQTQQNNQNIINDLQKQQNNNQILEDYHIKCPNTQCNKIIKYYNNLEIVLCECGTNLCTNCHMVYKIEHQCDENGVKRCKNISIIKQQQKQKQKQQYQTSCKNKEYIQMKNQRKRRKKSPFFPAKMLNWLWKKLWKQNWTTFLKILPFSIFVLIVYIIVIFVILCGIIVYDFIVWVILIPWSMLVKQIINNLLKFYQIHNKIIFFIFFPFFIILPLRNYACLFLCCIPYLSLVYWSYPHIQDIYSMLIGEQPIVFSDKRMHEDDKGRITFIFCKCGIGQECPKCAEINKFLWFQGNILFFLLNQDEKWRKYPCS